MNVKINISFDHPSLLNVPVTQVIKKCIHATLQEEKVTAGCEINVLITDDKGIHAINKASRNVDRPTDVLSFPMFQLIPEHPPTDWTEYLDPGTGLCPLGDMAISLERAREQADEFGHSVKREVGYLTIHSMLHLLGYDHMDDGPQKAQMRAHEKAVIEAIGLHR